MYLEIPPKNEMAQGDQMVHATGLVFEPRANRCNRTKLATQIPAINPFTYSRSRVLNSLNTPGPNFSILLKCRYLGEHTNTRLATWTRSGINTRLAISASHISTTISLSLHKKPRLHQLLTSPSHTSLTVLNISESFISRAVHMELWLWKGTPAHRKCWINIVQSLTCVMKINSS